ncbi:mitochondrial E3 ubiquitin protein ligase 1-like [Homalodisca vitripennis]|uniref:mitochondrial E3 ubiquitin protein ligase 1-like n=1 Tax=Homalodisca vitripennis TaxID=197043 RepID=UPI001EEB7672|nr:mitochondrial E3 ubiquitin protein ligase 1-like [Homalodisca vitripennis]
MSQQNTGAEKEEESQGSGFLPGLLLAAGGAAAVGFLAHKLVSDYKEAQSAHTSRISPLFISGVQNQENVFKVQSGEGSRTRKDMAFYSEIPEAVKCINCREKPRKVIMNPCECLCLCEDCGEKCYKSVSPICPVCERPVKRG